MAVNMRTKLHIERLPVSYFTFTMATLSSLRYVVSQRKEQRQANFFAGRARSAHRLPHSLETIFVQSTNPTPPSRACKRGCHRILSNLKPVFDAVGHHPHVGHVHLLTKVLMNWNLLSKSPSPVDIM